MPAKRARGMARYRVEPGDDARLSRRDPADRAAFVGDKDAAREAVDRLNDELEELQDLLWARQKERLLVVLQGMDTAGKDGVIRQVFDGVNPSGVKVAGFKVPTSEELARDFLWRVHAKVPAAGEIVIFNRSHYEDVLVVRVRKLVPPAAWKKRFRQILDFERLLAETGTTILKFFLHISKDEQKARLEARLADEEKRWKFNPGDLAERQRWDAYQEAYEEAISRTSTAHAPWYVVPADRKWYRDYVIATVLVETLRGLEMKPPAADFDPAAIRIE
jgi:PPK2 family polyphosphate:nucleotide phosphotransferase